MAGDWIKIRHNISSDPDVIHMASITKLDEFGIVGRLHQVWSWLDQHSESGTNVRISSAFLDRITACQGFADAMRTVGWLSGRDNSIDFPNYHVHNGDTAKRRALDAKRKSGYRDHSLVRDKCPTINGTNVPYEAGLEKRREDNKQQQGRDGRDFELAAMSPEAALADVQRHHPDIDCWNEYLKLKQLCAKQGTKPTWRGFLAWLRKASPVAKAKKGATTPEQNGAPISLEEQAALAAELAEMKRQIAA